MPDERKILPEMVRVIGRKKYWAKGRKRYAPVVAIGHRGRYLRVHWYTASAALAYGERAVARYQRLLRAYVEPTPADIALERQLEEIAEQYVRSWWWRAWAWLKGLVNRA